MTRKLYDLAGADENRRFSPHCWRARMALAHKGLDVETVAWRFTEKDAIGFSGQGTVPVLVDGDEVRFDSWTIASYLDEAYPDAPSLFGGAAGKAHAFFIKNWTDRVLHPGIIGFILTDLFGILDEADKDHFRSTREKRFGKPLEQVCAGRESRLPAFRKSLDPLRATLDANAYIGGEQPSFADYTVFGGFQWARCASDFRLLEQDDPIHAWRERLLQMYDGLAGNALGYAA